jgi:hypothetical protein
MTQSARKRIQAPLPFQIQKVVTAFNESHLAQMLGFLNITKLKIALLLNFIYAKPGIERVAA